MRAQPVSRKDATLVEKLSRWMPVGILGVLAVSAFRGRVVGLPGTALYAVLALAVTIAVHLLCGRRTLLSCALGPAAFVSLVNLF